MPAKVVAAGISVLPDSRAQLLHFNDKFLAGQCIKVFVHLPGPAPKGKLAVSRSLALASDAVLLTPRQRLSSRCVESGN